MEKYSRSENPFFFVSRIESTGDRYTWKYQYSITGFPEEKFLHFLPKGIQESLPFSRFEERVDKFLEIIIRR